MLVFLQAVLGFDNLLYISLESKRVPQDKAAMVRKVGIGLAIVLRIALLIVVLQAIETFSQPFAHVDNAVLHGEFTIHSLIVLGGGAFILYTALKEIMHMLSINELGHEAGGDAPMRSVNGAIAMIVVMNLVFSFDSILSAIALTKVVWVMATAIVISGVLMMVMADKVSEFLQRNRMYEVLGLFILFLVGVMLVTEGGHLAHLELAGHPVEAMSKSTFYFVLIVLVIVDVAQGRYQKKLDLERAGQSEGAA
ncbi:MAG: tellurium resistance protein TerC [Alphaproteobacteria bacterium]|nr:tellurium resistance protein TerC [Alphaproteobacteria bacterium]MCB9796058.1 tellurium resistance protein TerC [Alphaproteobacteria bacterium]